MNQDSSHNNKNSPKKAYASILCIFDFAAISRFDYQATTPPANISYILWSSIFEHNTN